MKLKTKICASLLLVIFIMSLCSVNTGQTYTSDSFSQQVGDTYEYIVTVSKNVTSNAVYMMSSMAQVVRNLGDQIRVVVTTTNTTMISTVLYDSIYGLGYNKSAGASTWDNFTYSEMFIAGYNSTVGVFVNIWSPTFNPHNETAVNESTRELLQDYWNFTSYSWVSGMNGYDGCAAGWNGSAAGDLNESKLEYKINADGVLQSWRIYNGTGGSWDLIFCMNLIPDTIASFAQRPGESYIWEVTVSKNPNINPMLPNVGDQIQVVITEANQTMIASKMYDTIYGVMYMALTPNLTWTMVSPNITLLGAHSELHGPITTQFSPIFVPLNVTAMSNITDDLFKNRYNLTNTNFTVQRVAYGYNGSATGDVNETKIEFKFTALGVLEYWRIYNGTGSGWELVWSIDLVGGGGVIPGFELLVVLCGVAIIMVFYQKKRKNLLF